MIYYRLDGFHHSENWLGAGDEEKLLRSRVRKVAGRTQVYNARLAEETYFFVSMLTTDAVKIGVIQKNVIPMEKPAETPGQLSAGYRPETEGNSTAGNDL